MSGFARYLWKCIELTVRGTWDTADTVGVVCGVIIAVVMVANPDKEQSAGAILAKLTVLILVIVFLTRLVSSPYLLYKRRDAEIAKFNSHIAEQDATIKQLEENNQLAAFLEKQHAAAKKGSLSSRANQLAQDILKFEEGRRNQSAKDWNDSIRNQPKDSSDKEAMQRQWFAETEKSQARWAEENRRLQQTLVPRIVLVAEEFRANDLVDPKLEQWIQNPHISGMVLDEIGAALSTLAIKMEEKENGPVQ